MNLRSIPESKTYPAANKCIYCGSTEGPLTEEHIIPYALGGNLKLPKASCRECQKMTWWAEDQTLRKMFLAPRTHLKVRSRKPKGRPTELKMGVHDSDGPGLPPNMTDANFRWVDLPIDDHPATIFQPVFPPPGLLSGIKYDGIKLTGTQSQIIRLPPPSNPGEQNIIMQPFHAEAFVRMILKIAHGLAIAEMGETFCPLLPPFIRKKRFDWGNVLGSTDFGRMKRQNLVHCSLHIENKYILARIKLFVSFGFRPYLVVVGRISGIEGYSYSTEIAPAPTR